MARQALSEKRTRHYARETGIPIDRILARGGSGHWMLFRTTDDRHGSIRAGTLEVEWDDENRHWSSCDEMRSQFASQPADEAPGAA